MCVEACPTEAITESKIFEFAFTNRRDAIYTKAELVVGDNGRPKVQPWEDARGAESPISGWMRATSPGGDASYEGRPLWSGDLHAGVRAAEPSQDAEIAERAARLAAQAPAPAGPPSGGHH
jgi:NADH-quinone oxidoreductase subunit I